MTTHSRRPKAGDLDQELPTESGTSSRPVDDAAAASAQATWNSANRSAGGAGVAPVRSVTVTRTVWAASLSALDAAQRVVSGATSTVHEKVSSALRTC